SWSIHDSVEAAKRGLATVQISSTAFITLGRDQARGLGYADLPIAVVPHPFGNRTRDEIRLIAEQCVTDIARMVCKAPSSTTSAPDPASPAMHASLVEVPADLEDANRVFHEHKWGDGLLMTPPTPERVDKMLVHTRRSPGEVVATIAPGYGAATIEGIAI